MSLQETLQKLQEDLSEFDVNNIDFNNIGVWPTAGKAVAWALVKFLALYGIGGYILWAARLSVIGFGIGFTAALAGICLWLATRGRRMLPSRF